MTRDESASAKRVLITGMSATGKSTVIAALAERGYDAIDLDDPEWSEEVTVPDVELTGLGSGRDWVWREDRVRMLFDTPGDGPLFIGGCAPNQGMFYPQIDHVVLLTAPVDVTVARLASRTTNPFGKLPGEVDRVLQLKQEIEPLLRQGATLEIDTSISLDHVVAMILKHAGLQEQTS